MESDKKHHGTGTFVPGSVRIIDFDSTSSNLLVRGSSAFGAGGFKLKQLVDTIKALPAYAQTGITLSDTPQIIDFCLIGFGPPNHKDKRIVTAEAEWFSSTPPALTGDSGPYPTLVPTAASSGNLMVYWPVFSIGPPVPTAANGAWDSDNLHVVHLSIDASTSTGPGYDFSSLVPMIRAALTNASGAIPGYTGSIKNAVIYVHCDSGINRTGAAIIAYLMQYGSKLAALGITPPASATTYNTLQQAQNAAAVDPPQGDSPLGGADQAVAEAYCNLLYTTSPTNPLSASCVPNPRTVS